MIKESVIMLVFLILISSAYGITGDFNNDCNVNYNDFTLFSEGFRKSYYGTYDENYDLNKDNILNVKDFFIFADYYGKNCGLSKPAVGVPSIATLYGDLDYDDCVTEKDSEIWNQIYYTGALASTGNEDFDNNGYVGIQDLEVLKSNLGRCFERDLCSKQYTGDERNKCLIILASKIEVINPEICRLIRDSENFQNENSLKNLCLNKVNLYIKEKGIKLPSFKRSLG